MLMNNHIKQKQLGVSLLEVLIALLIIAVGVLGITKMQALSISNTQVSGSRGLIALQASSIAASMHGNPVYWQIATPNTSPCNGVGTCSFSGTSTTYFGKNIPASCIIGANCVGAQMAGYEMNTRLSNLNQIAPSYTLNINCANPAGPTSCTIQINWVEKQTGGNATTASIAKNQSTVAQVYYLYVQP